MRILLISANTEQITMPVLPVGLACLAAATERAGHDVHLLNLMTRDGVTEAVEEAFARSDPQVVGLSVRNIDDQCMELPKFLLDAVKEVMEACRRLSRAPIVLGGAGYSIFPRAVLDYLGADMGIRGEGEEAFVTLLERLEGGETPADVPGIVLPGGRWGRKPEAATRLDRFILPAPGAHIQTPPDFDGEPLWLPFQTRRGCPMNCSYCSTGTIEGRVLRKRSVDKVAASLEAFAEAGFRRFFFVDNTFNLPPSYAEALCDAMIARKMNIVWRAILYPWKVRERLVEKMAEAGCREVSLGFESGSAKVLGALNKRFGPEDVRGASEALKRCGIRRMGFLLLGGPGETRDTVRESFQFADSLELESMKVTAGIRIYPGTALARLAREEGMADPRDDLLFPKFYMRPDLRDWLLEAVRDMAEKRPEWMC